MIKRVLKILLITGAVALPTAAVAEKDHDNKITKSVRGELSPRLTGGSGGGSYTVTRFRSPVRARGRYRQQNRRTYRAPVRSQSKLVPYTSGRAPNVQKLYEGRKQLSERIGREMANPRPKGPIMKSAD